MIEETVQGDAVEVDDLDASGVLDLVRGAEIQAPTAERTKLRAANQWVDIHSATAETGVEVWGKPGPSTVTSRSAAPAPRPWRPSVPNPSVPPWASRRSPR